MGSQPGDVHVLFAAPDNGISHLPGVVTLGIGTNFTTAFKLLALHTGPSQSTASWTFQPFGIPIGTTYYLQSVVLGPSSPGLPVSVSNVHEVSIAP